jgi:hypothetical protein
MNAADALADAQDEVGRLKEMVATRGDKLARLTGLDKLERWVLGILRMFMAPPPAYNRNLHHAVSWRTPLRTSKRQRAR